MFAVSNLNTCTSHGIYASSEFIAKLIHLENHIHTSCVDNGVENIISVDACRYKPDTEDDNTIIYIFLTVLNSAIFFCVFFHY